MYGTFCDEILFDKGKILRRHYIFVIGFRCYSPSILALHSFKINIDMKQILLILLHYQLLHKFSFQNQLPNQLLFTVPYQILY